MRFLNSDHVLSNMEIAAECILGFKPSRNALKQDFVRSVNLAQSSSVGTLPEATLIEFANPDLCAFLERRGVFDSRNFVDSRHLFKPNEQQAIKRQVFQALTMIRSLDGNLYGLINMLVGSIACYRIQESQAGSTSCCVGLIVISPEESWSVPYYAELIVHEFVHNSLFLEDMVQGVFPHPDRLSDEKALVTSVIRKTRRAYDKSYHSACVAAALMFFHQRIGNVAAADEYVVPIRRTLAELRMSDGDLRAEGIEILSESGREILDEVTAFVDSRDIGTIVEALRPTGPAYRQEFVASIGH